MANNDRKNVKLSTDIQSADIKPCFVTSDEQIFLNLHKGASQKAAEKVGIRFNSSEIGMIIINTGISPDGHTIENKVSEDAKKSNIFNNIKTSHYEVGIILEFIDFKDSDIGGMNDIKRIMDKIKNDNKDGFEKLRQKAFEGLKEYFKWFSGDNSISNLNINDAVPFIPDYDGKMLKVKDYIIQNMDDDDQVKYFTTRSNPKGKNGNTLPRKAGSQKPRIGYKLGYDIVYKKESTK